MHACFAAAEGMNAEEGESASRPPGDVLMSVRAFRHVPPPSTGRKGRKSPPATAVRGGGLVVMATPRGRRARACACGPSTS
jgi:hypothetical protein